MAEPTTFLSLPPELRQHILYKTRNIDDHWEEAKRLHHFGNVDRAAGLAKIMPDSMCMSSLNSIPEIANDMIYVRKQWDAQIVRWASYLKKTQWYDNAAASYSWSRQHCSDPMSWLVYIERGSVDQKARAVFGDFEYVEGWDSACRRKDIKLRWLDADWAYDRHSSHDG